MRQVQGQVSWSGHMPGAGIHGSGRDQGQDLNFSVAPKQKREPPNKAFHSSFSQGSCHSCLAAPRWSTASWPTRQEWRSTAQSLDADVWLSPLCLEEGASAGCAFFSNVLGPIHWQLWDCKSINKLLAQFATLYYLRVYWAQWEEGGSLWAPQVKVLEERAVQGNDCDLLSFVTEWLTPTYYKADNFYFQEAVRVHWWSYQIWR